MTPTAYAYWPELPTSNHPLYWEHRWKRVPQDMLPWAELTNDAETRCANNHEELFARFVVRGFGSLDGTATIASLLLDIGLPQTERTEFCLEGPSGYQSMAIGSAELRFWIGYDYML